MRMESGTEYIFHVFWEDSIWLPPNTTWKVKGLREMDKYDERISVKKKIG